MTASKRMAKNESRKLHNHHAPRNESVGNTENIIHTNHHNHRKLIGQRMPELKPQAHLTWTELGKRRTNGKNDRGKLYMKTPVNAKSKKKRGTKTVRLRGQSASPLRWF